MAAFTNDEGYCPYVDQCDVTIHVETDTFVYHDCRENVMRNLFNNILYQPNEDRFDISILLNIRELATQTEHSSTYLIDKIIDFYKKYDTPKNQGININLQKELNSSESHVTVDDNQLIAAGTEWASVLSGLSGVSYWWPTGRFRRPFSLGDTHEINAGIGNYLRVFAYLFGQIPPRHYSTQNTKDWTCPVLEFKHLEQLFASVGVDIKFIPDHSVPLPEKQLSKPATEKDVRFDNHDVDVNVVLKKGQHELCFLWKFVIGHLEVYFRGGLYDHPWDGPSTKYANIVATYLPPPSEEFVHQQMLEALSEVPLNDSQ